MSRAGRIAARVAAVVIGFVGALLLAEAAVRTFAPQVMVTEQLEWVADPTVGFRLAPDRFVDGRFGGAINELGLRGPMVGSKRARETRIGMLGDSFVFGAGVEVEQAMPAVLERLIRESRGDWRVINAGTPSYGTERQARWLRAVGDKVSADAWILCVFVGNDFTDNLDIEGPAVAHGKLVDRALAERPTWQSRLAIARAKSHLWRLAAAPRPSPPKPAPPAPPPAPPPAQDDPTFEERRARRMDELADRFARAQSERISIYAPKDQSPVNVRTAYERMETHLDEVREWCRARGLPLAVAILPDVTQVEDAVRERVCRISGVPPDVPDWTRPQRMLRDWCERAGVPCVDLLPAFRDAGAAGGEHSLYLFVDSHFNAAGHRTAAEAIHAGLAAFFDALAVGAR